MSATIGYARVSTDGQSLDLQIDALEAAGCTKIFRDVISGSRSDRPELEQALDYLRPGDKFVVWRLDRLGRSVRHLIEVVNDLQERGVGLTSLQEDIDTSSPSGKLVFHIFGALSEFERDLLRERTKAGLDAARRRGRVGGRKTVMTPNKLATAKKLYEDPESAMTMKEIADTVGISRSTLYRHLAPVESAKQAA
jgi:DNA invertase Pin-like site-specific DNA recombinase